MKILIVEDNADERSLLRLAVQMYGHEPVEAADGQDGLTMAARHRPDLIISDALMPRMDGFQLLRAVKKDKALQHIPFVFFSAVYKGDQDRNLAISLGAAAYIDKPKTPNELWNELRPILEEQCRKGDSSGPPLHPVSEEVFLKGHSRVVAAKLEEKIRELEQSEQRFRRLVESTTDYIYTVEVREGEGVRTLHGPGCVAITGYTPEEYEADPELWFRMLPDEDRNAVFGQARTALAGGDQPPLEHRIICKDGTVRWVRTTTVPHFNERGELASYDGLIADITERKEMEEKLQHAAREWTLTFDSMADAVSVHDADYTILRMNMSLANMLGYPVSKLLGQKCFEAFHRRSLPLDACPLEKAKHSRQKEQIEIFEPNVGTGGRWLSITASPVIDDKGEVTRVIHVARDITERKEAEAALEKAHHRNELLLACAGEGIYGLDAEGRVTFVNPAAARMLGYAESELTGKHSHDLWHHTREDGTPYPAEECPAHSALGNGQVTHQAEECPAHSALGNGQVTHQAEDIFWRADGTSFPVAYVATPIIEDDEPVGVVVVFKDITDHKEREEMLKSEMEMTAHLLMIAEASTHTSNLDRMMDEVTRCVSRITGCEICLSYLWDRDAGVFRPSQAAGLDHEMVPLFKTGVLRRQGGLIMALDASMGPLVIDSPSLERDDRAALGWIGRVCSMAIIPLVGMQDYLGLIITVCRVERRSCGRGERGRKVMEGIMHQVSTALEQARLYRDSIEKAMVLAHKMETIQVMNELDKSILSTLDSGEILESTTHMVARLVPCDRVIIALADREKGGFVRTAGFGTNAAPPGGLVPFTATSATEVIKTGSPQYEDNLGMNDKRLPLEERLFREGFLSHIRIPLRVKGEIAGVLTTGAKRASAYTPGDLATLEKLAYQIGVALENARLMSDLEGLFMGTVKTISSAIDAKSPWTAGHSTRVTEYAVAIGREMGLSEKELKDLELAGLLHDVGKLGTYESILDKPGRLTDEELSLMRQHPAKGAEILSPIRQMAHILPAIRHHHEFFDGNGYPDGLAGEAIPLFARIMTVADTADAMSADRPYRKGRSLDVIVEELRRCTGTQFDPKVVEAFLVLAERNPDMLKGASSPLTPPATA